MLQLSLMSKRIHVPRLESSSSSCNEIFEDKKLWEALMRVSGSTLSLATHRDLFQTDKGVSFIWSWCRPTKSILPVGLCQLALPTLCLVSTSFKNGKQCRREIDVSTQTATLQFWPTGQSCESRKKSFHVQFVYSSCFKQLLYCEHCQKSCLAWMQCPPLCIEPQ